MMNTSKNSGKYIQSRTFSLPWRSPGPNRAGPACSLPWRVRCAMHTRAIAQIFVFVAVFCEAWQCCVGNMKMKSTFWGIPNIFINITGPGGKYITLNTQSICDSEELLTERIQELKEEREIASMFSGSTMDGISKLDLFGELKLYLKNLSQSLDDRMSFLVHSPPPGNNITIHSKGIYVQVSAKCIHEKWRFCMLVTEVKLHRSHRICFHPKDIVRNAYQEIQFLETKQGRFKWHMKVLNASTAIAFMQNKNDNFDAYPSVENWDGVKLESNGQIFLSTTCSDRIGNAPTRFKHYMVNDMQSPPIHHAMCFEEWEKSYPTTHVRNTPMGTTPHDNRKPPLYKVLSVLSSARSTFGSNYDTVSLGHGDKLFFEFILQRYPAYKNIVEFGTFVGVFSIYLGVSAALRGGVLTSFDIVDIRNDRVKKAWLSNMKFEIADLENPDNISEVTVGALKSSDLLFGAGGNKDLEASIYAKYLPIGAGLFQHDYTYDHKRTQDNYEPLRGLGFEPMYEEVAKYYNSCGRFWIRKHK